MTEAKTDALSRDVRRAELEALTFNAGGQLFRPQTGRELTDMANMMAGAKFMVKDIYRDNPGACLGLIAICAPYGLNPLQVSWKTYKASKAEDAPIAFEAQVIVAMVNASGVVRGGLRYRYEGEGQSRSCIASGLLPGSDDALEVHSPMLSQITVKNSPLWKADPDQQLAYYTGRSWARRYKPEMLLGVYDVDELSQSPMRDVTPRDISPLQRKIAVARGQELPEAEVLPPQEPHWTAAIEWDGAFPGSPAWEKGVTAHQEGQPVESNPYDADQDAATDWAGGWHGAGRAAE